MTSPSSSVSNFDQFLAWVDASCSSDQPWPHPGRSLVNISNSSSNSGRCLILARSVKAGQCCYAMPVNNPRLLLTPRRCVSFLSLCGCFESKSVSITPFDCMVLFIHHIQSQLNSSACRCPLVDLWRPYFNVLPRAYSDPVYAFNHHQTMESTDQSPSLIINRLESSDVKASLNRTLDRFQQCWRRLKPLLPVDSDNYQTPSSLAWAWSSINSRCFYCPLDKVESWSSVSSLCQQSLPPTCNESSSDRPISLAFNLIDDLPSSSSYLGLLVLLDFTNHDPRAKVDLSDFDPVKGLRLTVDCDLAPGDELLFNYGPHTNLDLLCEYGFTLAPDQLSLTYDVIHPTRNILLSTLVANSNDLDQCLTQLGLRCDASSWWPTIYISYPDGPSYHLVLLMYVSMTSVNTSDDLFQLDPSRLRPLVDSSWRLLLTNLLHSADLDIDLVTSVASKDMMRRHDNGSNVEQFLTLLSDFYIKRRLLLTCLLDEKQ